MVEILCGAVGSGDVISACVVEIIIITYDYAVIKMLQESGEKLHGNKVI